MDDFRAKVNSIIDAAVAAPSGSNSQPWRFVVRGSAIEFRYLPERDHPLLNFEEGGTLIALGAAIENAELAARAGGLEPRTTYRDAGACVAVMELAEGGSFSSEERALFDAIPGRHSNRKAYALEPLPADFREAVRRDALRRSGVLLTFVEDHGALKDMAHALTAMEEIALTTPMLHKLFFEEILWSAADNEAGKQGLYLKTLEIPGPGQLMFKLLRNPGFARLAAKLGIPKQAAATNAKQDAAAAAFGVLSASSARSRATYLDAGRVLERVWLRATTEGLSMQVVTGITFLARTMEDPSEAPQFSSAAHERAREALEILRARSGVDPLLVFRVGRAAPPTEVSRRRAPEIEFAS